MHPIHPLSNVFMSCSLFHSSPGPRNTQLCKYCLIPNLWEETEPQSICLPAGSCCQFRQQLTQASNGEVCGAASLARGSQKPPENLLRACLLTHSWRPRGSEPSRRPMGAFSLRQVTVLSSPGWRPRVQDQHPEGQSRGPGLWLTLAEDQGCPVQNGDSSSWPWGMCQLCRKNRA